jgi:NAD(P)H-flavin reductase
MARLLENSAAARLGPREVIKTMDPMLPELYRIERLSRETHDTFTIALAPQNSGEAFRFLPGQFNMLYVFGTGEVPISISSDPQDSASFQHTTRMVGAVTRGMGRLKKGDVVGVRGPYGTHWPVEQAEGRDVVIVTGGIGLAPLRPVLYRLMAERPKYRRIVLLYGARSPEDILYRRELERWRSKFDLEIQVTVDRGTRGWRGNVGVVTTMIGRSPFDPSNAVVFACGPEVMMRFALMEFQRRGLASQNIYLSMERNMKCAIGFCGHCQYGPAFICKDGPVFRFDRIEPIFGKAEI